VNRTIDYRALKAQQQFDETQSSFALTRASNSSSSSSALLPRSVWNQWCTEFVTKQHVDSEKNKDWLLTLTNNDNNSHDDASQVKSLNESITRCVNRLNLLSALQQQSNDDSASTVTQHHNHNPITNEILQREFQAYVALQGACLFDDEQQQQQQQQQQHAHSQPQSRVASPIRSVVVQQKSKTFFMQLCRLVDLTRINSSDIVVNLMSYYHKEQAASTCSIVGIA
jgi:hypothetical protein